MRRHVNGCTTPSQDGSPDWKDHQSACGSPVSQGRRIISPPRAEKVVRVLEGIRRCLPIGLVMYAAYGITQSVFAQPAPPEPAGGQAGEASPPSADPRPTSSEGMNVVTTETGLKYFDIKTGDGPQPGPTSMVKVNYRAWLEDGTLFDSTEKKGGPAVFNLRNVIKGWIEGLVSMKAGGIRQLVIPPHLAYGNGGPPPIPPNATLTFEVELLDVLKLPEMTAVDSLPKKRLELVADYWDIVEGHGESPQPDERVRIHYSIWLKDGAFLYSSLVKGEPATMPVKNLFPGWAESILTMKVGGKRRLELPPPLGVGRPAQPGVENRPAIPADSVIIVEVDLLGVEAPAGETGSDKGGSGETGQSEKVPVGGGGE